MRALPMTLLPAEEAWRCIECSALSFPDEDGFIRTEQGPVCASCDGGGSR